MSGVELKTLTGHTNTVSSVTFSPDGTFLASGSDDNTIRLWDAVRESELKILAGHSNTVSSVAFSPDGTRVASGSWDKTIKLWDAVSGAELKTLSGHTSGVTSLAFSPDGKLIYSKDKNGTKIVWDALVGEKLPNAEWKNINKDDRLSPDKRWLVTSSGFDVLLVDLEFKDTPREKAYREFKAKPKPYEYREQAFQAEEQEDWYAATFHRAWLLKINPEQADAFDQFQEAYDRLKKKYALREVKLEKSLQPVVTQMLKLPRPVQ